MIYLVAFLAGAVSEYTADLLSIRWNAGVLTRSLPFDREKMRRHSWRMVRVGFCLLLLGAVDVGSVFGGLDVYLTVLAGSAVGGGMATRRELWRKWTRRDTALRGAKSTDDDEEE